ncbi:variant erythrocyte surface antigen-1 family protein [Babesia caballi]|uniref:Variant erythrocyte surface antigen-1 family protein n=1 Tax=Babesia caballi TaxID=5871 RepID=A0AAV4LV81_BABCB|nr:variant erythrocyte surface antigen-1 family protein [Babesia caballi]
MDWILRVTGKDGGGGHNSGNEKQLAQAITELPEFKQAIEAAAEKLTESGSDASKALQNLNNAGTLGKIIGKLAEGLAAFIGYEERRGKITGHGIGRKPTGKNGGDDEKPWESLDELRRSSNGKGYYYSYNPTHADWQKNVEVGGEPQKKAKEQCAKIFLGCLPIVVSALSHIYWRCSVTNGWSSLKLTDNSSALGDYLFVMGYHPLILQKDHTGHKVVEQIKKHFKDFYGATSHSNSTYLVFLNAVRTQIHKKLKEGSGAKLEEHPIASLYFAAQNYFTLKQSNSFGQSTGSPKSIREMLYFLAALPFSPVYEEFDKYITEYFKAVTGIQSSNDSQLKFSVADSAKAKSPAGDTLSAEEFKTYLTATCNYSPVLLGYIQGNSADTVAEPWLHSLFCNSEFALAYSSSSPLLSKLADYTYALQFQFHYIHSMCSNSIIKCGWQQCRFGQNMHAHTTSHICPLGCKNSNPSKCTHYSSGGCNHYGECGSSPTSSSPLQAFLTDKLQGFSLSSNPDPWSPNHLENHPTGSMCHVKMGFYSKLRDDPGKGGQLYFVLRLICGSSTSSLRQLCEKLGCLTKRTPRSLGDMFGFTWHLKGQLANTFSSIQTALWFKGLVGHTPFSYAMNKEPEILEKFVGSRKSHSSSHDTHDLKSLSNTGCKEQGRNCGPYLSPLTISNGATFGKPPSYASTYLSWMVYLTVDLQSGFQQLLDEFKNIDCKASGCRAKAGVTTACQIQHKPGTHGNSAYNCSCESVVHCGGVLPLLYRYGFTFGSTGALFGERNTKTKRNCDAFAKQLQSVISGNPLSNLLTSIDDFLYLFRYYFLGNLSAFWSIYMCLILYTFFFLLDTLQLRSHLKISASHMVPPLAILTSGTPLPVTKLTYITQ